MSNHKWSSSHLNHSFMGGIVCAYRRHYGGHLISGIIQSFGGKFDSSNRSPGGLPLMLTLCDVGYCGHGIRYLLLSPGINGS